MFKSNGDCCNQQRYMNAGTLAPQVGGVHAPPIGAGSFETDGERL
jgi:hypothetical protein